uniref:Cation-transporting P-type ATPase N-terminal domain-containing protein n=1 Tax=Ananas comosus var. bracteatus TaxID=296719 RepID=A0A6V7PM59_ANACO|nr:unnamed protein product [Ananas comosus var. bracteatus]
MAAAAAASASFLEEIRNESVDLVGSLFSSPTLFSRLRVFMHGSCLILGRGRAAAPAVRPNKLEEKKENKFLKFLGFMWNPLSWVMEIAAIMAIALANGGGRPPDWQDFVGIVVLLVINSTISFIEENNAGNAAAALMAGLAPKTKVLRDGRWSEQEAAILVPGDIISIKLGDIIPADARARGRDLLRVDVQAGRDRGRRHRHRRPHLLRQGRPPRRQHQQCWPLSEGVDGHRELLHMLYRGGYADRDRGNVPDPAPAVQGGDRQPAGAADRRDPDRDATVLSVTMAIGSHRLSEQGAITKRMTAIEEMAGMDVLCSDKTGTLTLNKLTVDKTMIEAFVKDIDRDTVVLYAARASRVENQDAIDASIVGMLADPKEARAGIQEVHFLPFNPVEKRTAITYIDSAASGTASAKAPPNRLI